MTMTSDLTTREELPRRRRKPGPKPKSDLDPVTIIAAAYRAAPIEERPAIRAIAECPEANAGELIRVIHAAGRLTPTTTPVLRAVLDALDDADPETRS